ncbi:unnamed protein product [Closterium sp. NIES-65]|nr:unnamed protein product [Closterium sp. NIES-65]
MEGVKKFTGRELEQATNKFHRENSLGRGGFGTGYKGQIDGQPVLVMKLNPDTSRQAGERFLREVTVLTRADHRHIVRLIGYNAEARCIVYEALPGGNLEDRLATEAGRKSLRQKDRLRIAAEVAEALVFLHRLDYPILHQDVKPANVMLDDDLISKLGGVGLAKFLPVNDSSIWGTVGYIDPLLLRTGKYGPQSDVYGLGLVVLQLLTGEKVNKVLEYAKFGLEGVLEHLDKEVTWNDKIVRDVAELALRCRDKANRPDLESVVLPALQILAKDTALDLDQDGAPPPRQAAGGSGARGGGGRGGHAGGRGAGRGAGEDAHKATQASAAKKSTSINGQQTSRSREGTSSGRPANDGEMRLEATRAMLESIRTTQDSSNSFAPSVLSPRSFAEVASPTGTAEPSSLPETSDSANIISKALDDAPAEKSGKDTVSYGTPDRPFGTRRRRSSMNDEPPPEFLCPITCELMADPVMVVTGQTYERSSIRQWISEGHRTCPITRMPLGNIELVPNYALRNAIRAWAQKRGIELKEPEFFPPPRISGAQYKTANNASAPSQIPTWDNALPDRRSPPMLAVTQLFVGSTADKDAAVAQLATTASEDGENGRVSVVQAGAIPPLIMVLLEGSDFAKETAARCIRFLSRSNNPIITQGSAAAIPALVRLLSVGSQAAKEAACGALVNLSAKTDVNKFQIAVAGGILPLVSLLDFNQPNASRTSYECASAALCNLAFDNENRLKIAAAGAIPLLVQV